MPSLPDEASESSQPQGISLDELTEAFAQVMATEPGALRKEEAAEPQTEGAEAVATAVEPPDEEPTAVVEPPVAAGEDDACEICPQTILEAMLFVGNRDNQPLSAVRAAELMRGVESSEIAELVDQLNRRYAANGCPYEVVNDGSGYRLELRKAFHALRNRFYGRVREARLSQAAIDTLAIVAYQQPLTAEQVNRLRGKPSGHVLSQLVNRGLLRLERRQEHRKAASYHTTDRFLELFGLESLDDLPQSEELDRA